MNMKKLITTAALLLIALAKCSTPTQIYINQNTNASMQLFLSDRYDCLQEATSYGEEISGRADNSSASISGSGGNQCNSTILRACFASRGWLRDYDAPLDSPNTFVVPESAYIYCGGNEFTYGY
jgi:hypothetical protein